MSQEVNVDDYIFERTITHLKLVTNDKIEECKVRQKEMIENDGKEMSLWDIVVDMHYLTKDTVDEVLESYINQNNATVTAAKNKVESVRLAVKDIKLKPSQAHKADVLFVKTSISNNFLTVDAGNSILEAIPKSGKERSWDYVISNGHMKEKISKKILQKLYKKFPLKFDGIKLADID
ncbi:MAG: hypothetical protein COA79_24025 [Planctomycetota bacterium]|nr:MAG: hypothetical protein COA79_24025 [Planctomycetota bacterium]